MGEDLSNLAPREEEVNAGDIVELHSLRKASEEHNGKTARLEKAFLFSKELWMVALCSNDENIVVKPESIRPEHDSNEVPQSSDSQRCEDVDLDGIQWENSPLP